MVDGGRAGNDGTRPHTPPLSGKRGEAGFPEPSMGMGRVGLVIGFWFVFWMFAGAALGALTAGYHGGIQNGIYYGAFNGAIFAFIASFAWPWIMPESLERWMDRGGA
jgi:hypothetical protein